MTKSHDDVQNVLCTFLNKDPKLDYISTWDLKTNVILEADKTIFILIVITICINVSLTKVWLII